MYCFVAGSLVTTEDGQKPIEEIQVGDKVLSEDETTGEVAIKEVYATSVSETDEFYHIHINGEEIVATGTHPFYVYKFGWTTARALRAGDVLVLSNGELVTVEWIDHEILESPIKVYNFEVEDFHTYFVGESGILVHNGKRCTTSNTSNSTQYDEYDIVPYNNKKYPTPGYEKHHGIMDKWASENIHGYTKNNAPTILLSDTNHGKTKGVYNTWKAEKFGTNPVDWKNVSSAEIRELSEKMFDAASIPISTRNEYYELFDLFLLDKMS